MTIILGILALGFLIFFHELGHFVAARNFGVEVEAFSIGMGPVLLHKKIGKTDYRISMIPLGGYCAMKGEDDFRDAIENNLKYIESSPDSFYGIHPLKRLAIAFAGPFANYFFGIIAFALIAMIGYTYYSAGTTVYMADEIIENAISPAHEAGMESGDTILAINGKKVSDFSDIIMAVAPCGDQILTVQFKRNDEIKELKIHSILNLDDGSGKIGIVSDSSSVIERKYPKQPFFPALREGFIKANEVIFQTFKSIRVLFKGVKISNAVSGPGRITATVGETMKAGFSGGFKTGIIYTMQILGIISLSLFLTNMLPIPVLDGGLIVFALLEWIFRKKLPPKTLYYIQIIGITLIVMLSLFSIGNDILYFVKKVQP